MLPSTAVARPAATAASRRRKTPEIDPSFPDAGFTIQMSTATETIEGLVQKEYKYGFITDVESDSAPPGLNEDIIRLISTKKKEPQWLLDWRLKAYRHW